jgi:hypothetical protein|tara:strand:- start:357 stop:560 length:204 start_codon:yes stop_codon:yes gene_type:complete
VQRTSKVDVLLNNKVEKKNEIILIVPPKVEKHLLMISPSVPTSKLPKILQRLNTLGATVLDVQKLDF